MKLFVADAKYRGLHLAIDTVYRSHGNPQLTVTTALFNGSSDNKAKPLTYTKDDAWIQSAYAALQNDGTAKSNTDFMMKYGTTKAAHHCRDQDIPGVGQLDMPNLYELIILYLESDNIDALDPTASSNRDKALGMMGTNGRFGFEAGFAWSSTERSANATWGVGCSSNGCGHAGSENYGMIYGGGITPVKELDA